MASDQPTKQLNERPINQLTNPSDKVTNQPSNEPSKLRSCVLSLHLAPSGGLLVVFLQAALGRCSLGSVLCGLLAWLARVLSARLGGWLLGWLIGYLVGCLAGWLASWLVGQSASWLLA